MWDGESGNGIRVAVGERAEEVHELAEVGVLLRHGLVRVLDESACVEASLEVRKGEEVGESEERLGGCV